MSEVVFHYSGVVINIHSFSIWISLAGKEVRLIFQFLTLNFLYLFLVIYDDFLTDAFIETVLHLFEQKTDIVLYLTVEKRWVGQTEWEIEDEISFVSLVTSLSLHNFSFPLRTMTPQLYWYFQIEFYPEGSCCNLSSVLPFYWENRWTGK